MAQASSSAQREPSMEEILASIRRIIEDSDAASAEPAGKQVEKADTSRGEEAGDPETTSANASRSANVDDEIAEDAASEALQETASDGSPTLADAAGELTPERVEEQQTGGTASLADVLREVTAGNAALATETEELDEAAANMDAAEEEVRSFREELQDLQADSAAEGSVAAEDHDASPDDESMSALNMADIEAQVAGQANAVEAGDAALSEEAGDAALSDETAEFEEAETEERPEAGIDEKWAADHAAEEEDDTAESHASDYAADEDGYGQAEAISRSEVAAASSAVAMNRSAAGDPYQNRAPIISEQAGRQVAAAFDELSEAFSHTRKFDQMAEEMMRPMLQDWLDNNLPTLVERLVREEIDRVARGASR